MKKRIFGTIGVGSLAVVAFLTFAGVFASAQKSNDQGIVGSWDLQVTIRDCNSGFPFVTFPAMNTYSQGGTTQQTALPEPGATVLPGHGVWRHDIGRNYSGAFRFLILNANPALTRRVTVRSSISLGLDGNSYTSTDAAEIRYLNGDLIESSCSTSEATRFE
jgi:hypothetical protein